MRQPQAHVTANLEHRSVHRVQGRMRSCASVTVSREACALRVKTWRRGVCCWCSSLRASVEFRSPSPSVTRPRFPASVGASRCGSKTSSAARGPTSGSPSTAPERWHNSRTRRWEPRCPSTSKAGATPATSGPTRTTPSEPTWRIWRCWASRRSRRRPSWPLLRRRANLHVRPTLCPRRRGPCLSRSLPHRSPKARGRAELANRPSRSASPTVPNAHQPQALHVHAGGPWPRRRLVWRYGSTRPMRGLRLRTGGA